MKPLYWILIVIVLVSAGVGGFFIYKKKKHVPAPVQDDNRIKGSEQVRALQMRLNALLPTDYHKLVIDGIYGSKTAAAAAKVKELQKSGNMPKNKTVATDTGIITINTDKVLQTVTDLAITTNPLIWAGKKFYNLF